MTRCLDMGRVWSVRLLRGACPELAKGFTMTDWGFAITDEEYPYGGEWMKRILLKFTVPMPLKLRRISAVDSSDGSQANPGGRGICVAGPCPSEPFDGLDGSPTSIEAFRISSIIACVI